MTNKLEESQINQIEERWGNFLIQKIFKLGELFIINCAKFMVVLIKVDGGISV